MRSGVIFWVLIAAVLTLSGWQIYGLLIRQSIGEENVLAATTTRTLEDRVAALESRVYTLERTTGLVKPRSTGKIKEQFVNLSGGSVNSADWIKIPGTDFSFDSSLYGSSVEVSWQGWIDNGYGSVRIYDSTNHRVVDYSDVSVISGIKSSFYSKPLSIWRGQNQYYIEGKNSKGELVVSSPRLRIVTR